MGLWRRQLGIVRKRAVRVVDASNNIDPRTLRDFCDHHIDRQMNGDIVCIDEAGFIIGDHGRYGYVSRGQRLNILSGKSIRRKKLTLLLAVHSDGLVDYKILPHNCKKVDFVHFIENLNVPAGCTLLMDNVAFHHSRETREAVKRKQCEQLFIPPYSPKFNAIENVFGVIKQAFRSSCPTSISDDVNYQGVMEDVLETFWGKDLTRYFDRALSFSLMISRGEPFINFEV